MQDAAQDFSAINPWRNPTLTKAGREARLKAQLKAARGATFLGVDVKVLYWVAAHVLVPIALYALGAEFKHLVRTAVRFDHGFTREHATVLLYIVLQLTLVRLFSRLYCSDPGWITDKRPAVGMVLSPCVWCGTPRSLRSHHCRATDQCVHKLDHFCFWLSTSIGDLNHARFVVYLVLQEALLLWLAQQLLPLLHFCLFTTVLESSAAGGAAIALGANMGGPGAGITQALPLSPKGRSLLLLADGEAMCESTQQTWSKLLLVVLALGDAGATLFLANLLMLHTYLAASGQTTLELLKGAGVPYMEPAFVGSGFSGPRIFPHLTLPNFVRRWWRGHLPPAPFSFAQCHHRHNHHHNQQEGAAALGDGHGGSDGGGGGPCTKCWRDARWWHGVALNLYVFFFAPKPYDYRYQAPYRLDSVQPPLEQPGAAAGRGGADYHHIFMSDIDAECTATNFGGARLATEQEPLLLPHIT